VTFFQRVRVSEFQTGPSRFSYKTIDIKSFSDWNTGWFSVADVFTVKPVAKKRRKVTCAFPGVGPSEMIPCRYAVALWMYCLSIKI